jgi:hypothetical protein
LPAVELFASIGRPVAQNVTVNVAGIEGARIAPEPTKEVFSGTPLVIFGDSPSTKELELKLEWQGGTPADKRTFNIPVETDPIAETLRLLQGARIISDFESRLVPASDPETKLELSRVERRLRQLSLEYGLASSQVSLVAVVKRSGDVKDQIPSTRVVAVGTAADINFEYVFACAMGEMLTASAEPAMARSALLFEKESFAVTRDRIRQIPTKALRNLRHASRRTLRSFLDGVFDTAEAAPVEAQSADDLLVSLSGMLEPDGGMPGEKHELRIANSLAALLFFYEHGNTATSGTFRMHAEKLIQFLTPQGLKKLEANRERAAVRVLEVIMMGRPVPSPWEEFVTSIVQSKRLDVSDFWTKVECALTLVESGTVSRE